MPELPEVETIRRYLADGNQGSPSILGMRVERIHARWPRTIAQPAVEAFQARLLGQTVQSSGRRGKYLLLHLDRDDTLLVHLRMSGDLQMVDLHVETQHADVETQHADVEMQHADVETQHAASLPESHQHTRLALDFDSGWRLAFHDARKFGRVWLTSEPQSILGGLGPEPLGEAFTTEWLYAGLQARRRQLKPLLLDQGFLAGLGNIYTDEALHRAGLHPRMISDQVSEAHAMRLWESIRSVLEEGITRQGASIDWVYRGGDFQNYFSVYQRTGEPCLACGSPIQRLVVGQRGTHICPVCQPFE